MKRTISNSDDVIDSRDVIARIEELTEERQALADALQEAQDAHETVAERTDDEQQALADTVDEASAELDEWDKSEEGAELQALQTLANEGEGCADWRHGEALIRDSYFKTYAQELADDIGAVKSDAGWPNSFIDWDAAADALKQDYTSVDYDGVEYWIRS